jgi:predicted CoA-substrate-specific enzyme activase
MITAGIDIGHQSVNTVLLMDGKILNHKTLIIAGGVEAAAKHGFDSIVDGAGLKSGDIDRVFATGVGREKVSFAHGHSTEMLCHVKGAHYIHPDVRTVIDVGAEGSRYLKCDDHGNLLNFLLNDKCASGAGVFLETVAGMMQVPLADMGPVSLRSTGKLVLTTTCAVFAESEIVAETHRGSSKEDILWGVHESIASKIVFSCKRMGTEPLLLFSGGVARNTGVVEAVKKQLDLEILVPENPEIVGALGAAILAAKKD